MLRAKPLQKLLAQVVSDGMAACMLMDAEGSIIASAGTEVPDLPFVAAIISNIWGSYHETAMSDATGHANGDAEADGAARCTDLQCLVMDCEKNRLAVTGIRKMVLCIVSGPHVEFGLLKAKLLQAKRFLAEPLSRLDVD
eukprot:EG_transcript_29197